MKMKGRIAKERQIQQPESWTVHSDLFNCACPPNLAQQVEKINMQFHPQGTARYTHTRTADASKVGNTCVQDHTRPEERC